MSLRRISVSFSPSEKSFISNPNIAEIQESDILDIITEKILTNHLSLNSDYGESYRSLTKWIHGFEEHMNKHVFE